jgi:predicted Zn finger-like uncharacterized protein
MTLATRCPSCGTVFRVVQDQLRVSQGWVRCGRCSEAFNALESMVDVPTALSPETTQSPPPEPFAPTDFGSTAVMEWPDGSAAPIAPAPLADGPVAADDESAYVLDDPPAAGSAGSGHLLDLPLGMNLIASDGALVTPIAGMHDRAEPPFDVDAHPVDPVDVLDPDPVPSDDGVAPQPFVVLAHATPAAPATAPGPAPVERPPSPAASEAPSFLVQAERAERWRRPGVRLALALLALLGLAGLAGQATYAFRDRIAAGMPSLRPLLQQGCAALDCRVGEFRQIESLSVESSGLVRVEGSPVYRLSVTLRNRAGVEVAAPALDLALTDAQGRPIARRVLQMSDLYLPLRALKPGSELPIQVPLGIADRPVSGYTIEIFYP